MQREDLLRLLCGASPGPQNPNRRLILPTEEQVAEATGPAEAKAFGERREALFQEMMLLFSKRDIADISLESFCRYQLLALLFGNGSCTVGEAWQPVHALRGADALQVFETALKRLLQSDCIEVIDPE